MAGSIPKLKFNQSLFWQRLSDAHLFTWGYLGFHLFSMTAMRLFLNSDNFQAYLSFWLAMIVLEHVFIFSIYGLAKRYVKKYSGTLVVIGALVIGTLRTLITTSLEITVGADSGVAWAYQLLLGALYELLLVAVWANVNGAYRDHHALLKELNETKNSILGYRENAEEMLTEEQDKLIALTQDTLLPQIQLVEDALKSGSVEMASRWGIAHELKGIIYNQVRPLSESLRLSAKNLAKPAPSTPSHLVSVISLPRSFRIKNSIFPKVSSAAMLLSYMATPFWLLDISWVIPSTLLAVTFWGMQMGFKKLFESVSDTPWWLGFLALVAIATTSVLPAYLVAVLFYPNLQTAVLYGLTLVTVSNIVVLSFAYLDSLDHEARLYRGLLEEQNEELVIEMALFEQQLWAARRNWSLVIHGTVQAALTAALTRLNAPDADKKTIDAAKKDLDRAVEALSTPPVSKVNFAPAIKELVSTWQGVCDIEVEVSPELKKVISRDVRLSMCVNEILKEAVSNAVRHGDAQKAWVSMAAPSGGVIELSVANDGFAPMTGGRKGLGSGLLDELTVGWSLGYDENNSRTILRARLPFSAAQA
jgi:two-component sensor histidine kinase